MRKVKEEGERQKGGGGRGMARMREEGRAET